MWLEFFCFLFFFLQPPCICSETHRSLPDVVLMMKWWGWFVKWSPSSSLKWTVCELYRSEAHQRRVISIFSCGLSLLRVLFVCASALVYEKWIFNILAFTTTVCDFKKVNFHSEANFQQCGICMLGWRCQMTKCNSSVWKFDHMTHERTSFSQSHRQTAQAVVGAGITWRQWIKHKEAAVMI